jgi:GT2 family glycosyltransferase
MKAKTEIDIIILSYAHNLRLSQVTKSCLISLLQSEDESKIKFNIVVVESQKQIKPYQYPGTTTIYPDQTFGYNKFMNLGVNATQSEFICICNNDLIFHPKWASEILKQMEKDKKLVSASPISSNYHSNLGINLDPEIIFGNRIGIEITGWCLFFKREIIKTFGIFDENYHFSGADYDYAYLIWVCNLKHGLVTKSIVDHLGSLTLKTQSPVRQQQLTEDTIYHKKKWASRISSIPDELQAS